MSLYLMGFVELRLTFIATATLGSKLVRRGMYSPYLCPAMGGY